MTFEHAGETYETCDLKDAQILFVPGGGVYYISGTRNTDLEFPREWVVKCYGEQHDGFHFFRQADLAMLKLTPARRKYHEFEFMIQPITLGELRNIVKQKEGERDSDFSIWAMLSVDGTDLGNVDFQYPSETFFATLDKPTC